MRTCKQTQRPVVGDTFTHITAAHCDTQQLIPLDRLNRKTRTGLLKQEQTKLIQSAWHFIDIHENKNMEETGQRQVGYVSIAAKFVKYMVVSFNIMA